MICADTYSQAPPPRPPPSTRRIVFYPSSSSFSYCARVRQFSPKANRKKEIEKSIFIPRTFDFIRNKFFFWSYFIALSHSKLTRQFFLLSFTQKRHSSNSSDSSHQWESRIERFLAIKLHLNWTWAAAKFEVIIISQKNSFKSSEHFACFCCWLNFDKMSIN